MFFNYRNNFIPVEKGYSFKKLYTDKKISNISNIKYKYKI